MNGTNMAGRGRVAQFSELTDVVPLGYVYVVGQLQWYFPTIDIEKEYLQLAPDKFPAGITTEAQRLQYVLQKHIFFAREMGWTIMVAGQPGYILRPRNTEVLESFIQQMVPPPNEATAEHYMMILGTGAPMIGGIPGALVIHTESFSKDSLAERVIQELTKKGVTSIPTQLEIVNVFTQTLQLSNNTGDLDEHRALNYVCVNYPEVYVLPTIQGGKAQMVFLGVETTPSVNHAGGRTVINVIFKYQNMSTETPIRYFTSVDVTGQFPFIVERFQPYFTR